jgi:hypothetical protein
MSEAFYRRTLWRIRQLKTGLIPIIEPEENITLGFPVLGRVQDVDITHLHTVLIMTRDECEHLGDMASGILKASGKNRVYQSTYDQALELACHVEILITDLEWKLRKYFALMAYDDGVGGIFLYKNWIASVYPPGYQVPEHLLQQEGHA